MKTVLAALAMSSALLALPAQAEVIDLATIKCSELATMSEEDAGFIMTWLHGYYGGQAGDTTMDTEGMKSAGEAIGTYCASNPEVGILSAVQQALGSN